ncbi:DUF559 domain-containing protein [Kytococcus sedentarius]|uniref:DUF559 domain-containing protein n=1 Tax=Kytococcus sedentarius (strain ATCC 14392 / DSM 20547 / JCM 11482 / CCUG 33030 / NBRC 15357 / NCTC 11040 / CCM 314 / 541) TaxID=478801 RepID=C7NIR5_KYTSD|nr:DUF559 domain-containing protein [Kytococcus sedentarius]ACV06703.1 hypothetical protein Ksed_16880 [Kytococcus sedentarius DSM 20547]QQB64984.1 DUF559 domain-containing protein [Kytococcus sedentarius]
MSQDHGGSPRPEPGTVHLLDHVRWRDGVTTLARLEAVHVSPSSLARAVRLGLCWRPAPGIVARGQRPEDSGAVHRLRTLGYLLHRPGECAASATALTMWGLPLLGRPGPVHLGGPRGRIRQGAGALRLLPHHAPPESVVPPGCRETWAVSDLPRALVAHASERESTVAAALVPLDAALQRRLVTRDEVAEVVQPNRWGVRKARAVLDLADAGSESPGETLTRLALVRGGLRPTSQVRIATREGTYRVDLLLEAERIVVEFDGAVKYDGVQGRDALVAEKRREDALREAGYNVLRVTWRDVVTADAAGRLLHRVQQLTRQVGRRPGGG